jgi:hypothetical protein
MLERTKLARVGAMCAAALTAALVVGSGNTRGIQPPTQAMVEIVDRTDGRVLPVYWHQGRRCVVGKPGNEYAIRVRNPGGGRLLAVMSVDGINVITGDAASPQQSGYVLAPYQSADIEGWRKNMSRTAAFYFTVLPDSYAARTGRPENVGVIGVAVFRERARSIVREEIGRTGAPRAEGPSPQAPPPAAAASARANAATDAVAQAAGERVGTGHGRNEDSFASYTRFERASDTPAETIVIYYDSYENLLAQGVPVFSPPLAPFSPNPFPDTGRFVPDPSMP